jgi:hypothetical protein
MAASQNYVSCHFCFNSLFSFLMRGKLVCTINPLLDASLAKSSTLAAGMKELDNTRFSAAATKSIGCITEQMCDMMLLLNDCSMITDEINCVSEIGMMDCQDHVLYIHCQIVGRLS